MVDDQRVALESFSRAVVHPTMSNRLAVLRNQWDDSRDLGRHDFELLAQLLAQLPAQLRG